MTLFKRLVLFLVPVLSIAIFLFYVLTAGGPGAAQWGAKHGVNAVIVLNYRNVNAVSLMAWIATLAFAIGRRPDAAQKAAIFGIGFVLCDILFYLPMARLAGEGFPWDQIIIVGVQSAYVLTLPRLAVIRHR